MLSIDRGDFRAWLRGELFTRDAAAHCLVGDHRVHDEVAPALDRGERVYLTVRGECVSYLERARTRTSRSP